MMQDDLELEVQFIAGCVTVDLMKGTIRRDSGLGSEFMVERVRKPKKKRDSNV